MSRLLAAILLLAVLGCRRGRAPDDTPPLTILAASSLTESFGELKSAFEERFPDTKVEMSFAGSQILRLQIEQGAPADVFAAANRAHVGSLKKAGLLREVKPFAENSLALIVPKKNESAWDDFYDLHQADKIVVGTKTSPIGHYTSELWRRLEAARGKDFARSIVARIASEESNVRLVRAKVELGEADAAVVYQTDTKTSAAIAIVPIPSELNVRVTYFAGQTRDAKRPEAARKFLSFLASQEARTILERHGFHTGASP